MKENKATEEIAHDGESKLKCPHCDYLNPRPQSHIMQSVEAIVCRRCQTIFPWDQKK